MSNRARTCREGAGGCAPTPCRALALCLALALALPVPASAEEPLSAIDWLSNTVREAPTRTSGADDIARSADVAEVETSTLDTPRKDAVGLLAPAVTGLPHDLWANSTTDDLAVLIARQRIDALPAVQELLYTLLLAELDPPADSGADARLLLARLDKLLELGALDQAQALLERAGPTEPAIFRRWFDVSLLTGRAAHACDAMRAAPGIAPTLPARVFCLARGGDWNAAVLTMETGRTLGRISADESTLLARFLDPELFSDQPDIAPPAHLTPLVYVMREAVAQPRPTGALPLAFLHPDLSANAGWKAQIEATERLARTGALAPARLMALYLARKPAASGGVWDRVRVIQAFDVALLAGKPEALAYWLPRAAREMRSVGLEVAFARFYGERLGRRALTGAPGDLALRTALLSDRYEAATAGFSPADDAERFLLGLARGDVSGLTPTGPMGAAVADGFETPLGAGDLRNLIGDGRLGEAILRAMLGISQGARSDPRDISAALALFRQVGLEDIARRTALQIMILKGRD